LVRSYAIWLVIFMGLGLAGSAHADDGTLTLLGGRFDVQAHYRAPAGEGEGRAVALSSNSGYFWFFDPGNVEVLVKVVDGCDPYQRFWFFAAGLTNVEVTLRVTDTWAKDTRTYTNPAGRAFLPVQDTAAFDTCGAPPPCGQGTVAEIAATPRADRNAEWLALFLGGGLTAPEGLYQRIAADLDAIRAANPATRAINYTPKYSPEDFIFIMTKESFGRLQDGQYHDWDCLNQWYGLRDLKLFTIIDGGVVYFQGRLDMKRVIADYARLPGLLSVETDGFLPPPEGTPPRLCAWQEGAAIHYFFQEGPWGTGFWEYTSDAPGAVPRQEPPNTVLFQECIEKYSW
jgi:hypothetical protein